MIETQFIAFDKCQRETEFISCIRIKERGTSFYENAFKFLSRSWSSHSPAASSVRIHDLMMGQREAYDFSPSHSRPLYANHASCSCVTFIQDYSCLTSLCLSNIIVYSAVLLCCQQTCHVWNRSCAANRASFMQKPSRIQSGNPWFDSWSWSPVSCDRTAKTAIVRVSEARHLKHILSVSLLSTEWGPWLPRQTV